jgi:hypothetical protein
MTPSPNPPQPPGSPDSDPPDQQPLDQPDSRDRSRRRNGADSAGFSTGSSAASFIADPGPAFDKKRAPAPPVETVEAELAELADQWDEPRIREILTLQGEITHGLLHVVDDDDVDDTWLHTERDLRAIAPPLTRILNRYDVTRAAAAAGDEALLAAAVIRYGTRNFAKRRRLLAAIANQEPQPVTGREAPPESGPEHDEQWQRVRQEAPPALTPKGPHHR